MFLNVDFSYAFEQRPSPDQFGEWYVNCFNYVYHSVKECGDDEYWNVELFPEQKCPEDVVYLVIAVCNSGDSFGSSWGEHNLIFAFTNIKDALDLKKFLLEDYKKYTEDRKYSAIIPYKGVNIYTPYKGYFDSLTDVLIEQVKFIPKD